MRWLSAHDYWLARFVFGRGLALVYLVAFTAALNQFRPLLGERGLLPAPDYLRHTTFRHAPSVFHIRYSDRFFGALAWTGIGLALCEVFAFPERAPGPVSILVWLILWALYLSIVNVGQVFYAFGWESLLLEAGFLGAFLGPFSVAPPVTILWLMRWLLFRLEFGAGLIKMRGDRCWRDLTCLYYHHETQPMPNSLSWWFHRLPKPLHRIEVLGNHAAQLVAPVLLFAPQPISGAAAGWMVATQAYLVASGNFSWLNWLAIVLGFSVFDDAWLHRMLGLRPTGHIADAPVWFGVLALAATALVVYLSWWPARNLAWRHQLMNAKFNAFHLVNTYGAFGSVTKVREEVVVEGTTDAIVASSTTWQEYEFKGKPTDPTRRPPQVAPYHLRLDWLMWFIPLSPGYADRWFVAFLHKLLENDRATTQLLQRNPFASEPPRYVRALLYRYRFTTPRERKETGAWWSRTLVAEFVRPVSLRDFERSDSS